MYPLFLHLLLGGHPGHHDDGSPILLHRPLRRTQRPAAKVLPSHLAHLVRFANPAYFM
jgi:hypothetical protein